MTILLIDNYDSFTYNLKDYFEQLECNCLVYRNDEIDPHDPKIDHFDVLVLSPGPMKPRDTRHLMDWVRIYEQKCPILGICLGHQALGEHFGATLRLADEPVHGKTTLVTHSEHPIFTDIENPFEAMRYHSLIIEDINAPLKTLAMSSTGEIMSIAHENLPVAGIQFHPESILTPAGLSILGNFLTWVKTFE